jgi:hypothetical protein
MYLGLTGHCVGTIVGEETIYSFSSTIFLCWIKGVEVVVVVVAFCESFEQTIKRMNFAVCEITLWHYFCGIVVRNTYGIM